MMRIVLLTSVDCGFCPKAKEKLKPWIDRGEIEVKEVETDDEGARIAVDAMMLNEDVSIFPQLCIVDSEGNLFSTMAMEETTVGLPKKEVKVSV
ncbi:MAG: hypothetical protein Q7K03_02290 [Dehalococcoidia bacterium]|nr:hypothetical protein [Dehalococcoidia bacterium]